MSNRQLLLLIPTVFVVAVVSRVVDVNTGDTTGPPYDDSLLNKVFFYTFLVSTINRRGTLHCGPGQMVASPFWPKTLRVKLTQ